MIKDQMFLFPEYDFFAQKEKKIDFMHLDEIKNSSFTKKKYSYLPKKKIYLVEDWRNKLLHARSRSGISLHIRYT